MKLCPAVQGEVPGGNAKICTDMVFATYIREIGSVDKQNVIKVSDNPLVTISSLYWSSSGLKKVPVLMQPLLADIEMHKRVNGSADPI